jgi:hypothetical protein
MGRRIIRWLGTLMVGLLLVYASLLIGVFAAMHQPIERFGKIMSYVPGPLFMVVPFEPMWNVARSGALDVGEPAPDFVLRTADKKGQPQPIEQVQLSSFHGRQPVVLVFGSYT